MIAMTWVVIASYSYPHEAQIAKSQLEAAGIIVRIENEHTINMYWLYSNALGGVRLLVLQQFAEEAYALIHQDQSAAVLAHFGLETPRCPNCGGDQLNPFTQGKRQAFIVFLLLDFPLYKYRHGMKCASCNHFIA